MKRKIRLTVVICFVLLLSVSYSYASSNDGNNLEVTEKEQSLVEKMINSNESVMYDGDLKIKKLGDEYIENEIVGVEGFTEDELEQVEFYRLENTSESATEETSYLIVADMYLSEESDDNSEKTINSRGLHNYDETNEAGRTTLYLKVSYTSRDFDGAEYRKLTKIQGKVVDYPTTLTLRKFTLKYRARGGYYTSTGTRGGHTTEKTESKSWTSSFKTLRTLDTSSIDKFYNSEGLGMLQARAIIRYGPSNYIVDKFIYYNVCALTL